MVCTWLGELCYCSCFPVLPGLANLFFHSSVLCLSKYSYHQRLRGRRVRLWSQIVSVELIVMRCSCLPSSASKSKWSDVGRMAGSLAREPNRRPIIILCSIVKSGVFYDNFYSRPRLIIPEDVCLVGGCRVGKVNNIHPQSNLDVVPGKASMLGYLFFSNSCTEENIET